MLNSQGYSLVFDAQFINNCALMEFQYALMQFIPKCKQTLIISTFKQSPSFCINF